MKIAGREAFFSGAPCQVAGLRGYLGRDWPNLITVDLVCHGVPSEAMFRSMVSSVERGNEKQIIDFRFRCKRNGWGHSLLLRSRRVGGARSSQDEESLIPAHDSAYYDLFLNLKTLRDSCYACPFASSLRPADITLGDFWGVQRSRPDVLEGARFDMDGGVSCLPVNTERGRVALGELGGDLNLFEVSFDDIAKGNDQLRHPSALPEDRGVYLAAFRQGGWDAVESLWQRRERGMKYHLKRAVKRVVPKRLIDFAKSVAVRGRELVVIYFPSKE